MESKTIDACAQIGLGDRKGDLLESNISTERILNNMDHAGVTKSVIYSVTYNDYSSGANEEVLEAIEKYPDRFIGFVRLNPNSDNSKKIFSNCVENLGFKGLRLRTSHDQIDLGSHKVKEIFNMATDYNIPIAVDGERDKSNLLQLIKDYPKIPIILTHLGSFDNWDWKNTTYYADLLKKVENFYLASCFIIIQAFLVDAIENAPEKVLYGSDSTTLPPSMELKRIETIKLDIQKYSNIVGGNLLRILS